MPTGPDFTGPCNPNNIGMLGSGDICIQDTHRIALTWLNAVANNPVTKDFPTPPLPLIISHHAVNVVHGSSSSFLRLAKNCLSFPDPS